MRGRFRWKRVGAPVSERSATADTGEPAERGDQSTISSIHIPSVHRYRRGIGRHREELEEFLRDFSKFFFGVIPVLLMAGACSTAAGPSKTVTTLAPRAWPSALRIVLGGRHAPTNDTFEVFTCAVPLTTTDPIYGRLTLRLALTPAQLVIKLNDTVTPYFEALSHGRYHPRFTAGSTLSMKDDETHDHCVERAVDKSAPDASGVMVIATAEHLSTEAGGWGRPGTTCAAEFCPAARTRRALYVGASDFHVDWGPVPAVDLTEHEMGHTLGLPHSGDPSSSNQHDSALDLMSNSASPRDVDRARRNGPDTLAINRVALGWLSARDLVVASRDGGTFTLSPSTGARGLRLLVLPLASDSFLTVEYLTADGFNDFLPSPGLAVHKVDQPALACGDCAGSQRVQTTLGGAAPHLQLLSTQGSSWVLNGWKVTVGKLGATVQVEVRPSDG